MEYYPPNALMRQVKRLWGETDADVVSRIGEEILNDAPWFEEVASARFGVLVNMACAGVDIVDPDTDIAYMRGLLLANEYHDAANVVQARMGYVMELAEQMRTGKWRAQDLR
jgi:hypothetical protein